jgi:Helix-turn-helix domain of resolvase/Resolvase, N terminal domain
VDFVERYGDPEARQLGNSSRGEHTHDTRHHHRPPTRDRCHLTSPACALDDGLRAARLCPRRDPKRHKAGAGVLVADQGLVVGRENRGDLLEVYRPGDWFFARAGQSDGDIVTFHLFGALPEFERELTRERTTAGLAAARARGRSGGRPRAMTSEKLPVARQMYEGRRHTLATIAATVGVSRSTLYRHLGASSACATG